MKNVNEFDLEDTRDVVLCVIVPFVLFWGGILLASFFPYVLIKPLGLFPFFVYVYFGSNLSVRPVFRNMLLLDSVFGLVSIGFVLCVFIVLVILDVWPDVLFLNNFVSSSLVNAPLLLVFVFFGAMSVGGNMRWGCWDEEWPDKE